MPDKKRAVQHYSALLREQASAGQPPDEAEAGGDAPGCCEDAGSAGTGSDIARYEKVTDLINHPKHYTNHPSGIECIQVTEHFGFNLGNVIKYIWRSEEKGAPLEDLQKARWYLNREIKKRGGE